MKSLKLSGIAALLLFSVFYSCKKDSSTLSSSNLVTSRSGGPGGTSGATVNPTMVVTFNPDPATVNQSVTVTGSFDGATAIPDCGKLQLFQKIDGTWVKVADADVSSSVHSVAYNFTPTVAGDDAYEFYVHYISAGCSGFSENKSGSFFLDVQNQCVSVFTIAPSITATNLGNGLYEFSVTYTLTSPVNVTGIKFQGGATAGGNYGHQVTDLGNTVVVNETLNNTVLKWEGDLTACTPQEIHFKFTRQFSCPATNALITGAWSASAGGVTLGSIDPVPYSCQ
ncbi:MAG TPA: hypothetical protein VFP87_04060 [Chitinophagaceae bacterium]|nr:hypothetical protein [Chitinophagaceae bacterium]